MKLTTRTHAQSHLLDGAVHAPVEAPAAPVEAGPGPALVPEQRRITTPGDVAAQPTPQVAPAPRRRHLRHRWEIIGGDDGLHLIAACPTCGKTKRLAAPARVAHTNHEVALRHLR